MNLMNIMEEDLKDSNSAKPESKFKKSESRSKSQRPVPSRPRRGGRSFSRSSACRRSPSSSPNRSGASAPKPWRQSRTIPPLLQPLTSNHPHFNGPRPFSPHYNNQKGVILPVRPCYQPRGSSFSAFGSGAPQPSFNQYCQPLHPKQARQDSSSSYYNNQNGFILPIGPRYPPCGSSFSAYGSTPSHLSFNENQPSHPTQARHEKKMKFVLSRKTTRFNDNSQENNENCVVKYVGYKYIHDLNEKNPHEIICEILKPNSAFAAFLNESELEADWLMLIVKILKNVCLSSFRSNISEMLNHVLRSQLMHAISFYLSDIEMEKGVAAIANMKAFIEDITQLLTSITNILPSIAVERDLKKVITKTIKAVEKVNNEFEAGLDANEIKKLETLVLKIDNYKEVSERSNRPVPSAKQNSYQDKLSEMSPPDDFRTMSLHPTYSDLMRGNLGFLRPNKVKGAYQDANHYLDVQYRLLREDFIDPLRRGVKQYLEAKSALQNGVSRKIKSKYESVRFYHETKFECGRLTKSHELGFVLIFDANLRLKIKWEFSKRFMFGSLLLFTSDNFDTFFYGTVLERDEKLLRDGRVLVKLPCDLEVNRNFFERRFLMAESEVFFEPYFLVMKRLQMMEEEEFPMPKYIIFGERHTQKPSYMKKLENWDVFGHSINPTQNDDWPTAAELQLDESQYVAFKTALTSDFCVIQGPPGTGKTFIGLKIMQVLLKNIQESSSAFGMKTKPLRNRVGVRPPILVVCYTNHALDQFLEGILPYTTNIVRAGSRSNSDLLKNYNLRGRNQIGIRREARMVHAAKSSIVDVVEKLNIQMQKLTNLRNRIDNPCGILKLELLENAMNTTQKRNLKTEEDLLRWLIPIEDDMDLDYSATNASLLPYELPLQTQKKEGTKEEGEVGLEREDEGLVDELLNFEISDDSPPFCVQMADYKMQYMRFHPLLLETERALQAVTDPVLHSQLMNRERELRFNMHLKFREFKLLVKLLENRQFDYETCKLISLKDMNQLSLEERWFLYWSWVAKIKETTTIKLNDAEKDYASKLERLSEYRQMEDVFVVNKADVVGMTTTCAARLHHVLQTVKPAVVIVEEAAEVLEAHIVSSLTEACEQVILIGDHKQLKPSAAVYELCKTFNMDISLFERMINNGMYCPMLQIQHRMRPEISKLITPLIYPDLKDDESVHRYKRIKGVCKSMFFLEHNEFEEEVDDSSSKKNRYEVDFLLKLCDYLIQQGYDPSEITILTTYSGQMFLFREKKRQYPRLADVKCIVVDKYQGEENEIILLSLVRSNKDAKIGFLKTENRVCVALSRAKKGLYIVGNMDNLCDSSQLWQEIRNILQRENAIGRKLKLFCKKHVQFTNVANLNDFDKVSQGGCNTPCAEPLKCGHTCPSVCHKVEHEQIRCHEPCLKFCPRLHPCEQFCYEKCKPCRVILHQTLGCGHVKELPCHVDENGYQCEVIIDDISPVCQHAIKRKCSKKAEETSCDVKCGERLDCGHVCPRKCHKNDDPDHLEFKCRRPCEKLNEKCSESHPCEKMCFEECGLCKIKVQKKLPCGHEDNIPCCTDLNVFKCHQKCKKSCENCKAKCLKKCFENCAPCPNMVKKKIEECGHVVAVKCSQPATRKYCTRPCERKRLCGHKCRAVCSKPCEIDKCREPIRKEGVLGLCGHNFVRILCFQQDEIDLLDKEQLLKYCDEPCGAKLKCGDTCVGTCGLCWQGRMHKNCQENCGNVLICGHTCKVKCREVCPPCGENCNFRCKHSVCPKKCGVPCVSCKEKCDWKCKHTKCTRKCGQICNRQPCYEACSKKLPCKHECIGYCGEPCPPLCRECNPEIKEIIFGWEDEPDARFVFLEDCGHTIESRALDQHLQMSPEGGEIVVKACPLCKTPIVTTLRFMNIVKMTYKDIQNVKRKIFGSPYELVKECERLSRGFWRLKKEHDELIRLASLYSMDRMIRKFVDVLDRYKNCTSRARQINVSATDLTALTFFFKVFESILSRLDDLFLQEVHYKQEAPQMFQLRRQTPRKSVQKKLDSSKAAKKALTLTLQLIERIDALSYHVNQQQSEDISLEVARYSKMVDWCVVLRNPSYSQLMNDNNLVEHRASCENIEKILFGCERFNTEEQETVNNLFLKLKETLKSDRPLTREEKQMIHLAMSKDFHGGGKGHWFTCSRGHYYCITECGGAMQESQCPDCGEKIGGRDHRYVDTMRLASDMDGATRSAWSSGHELRNYGGLF